MFEEIVSLMLGWTASTKLQTPADMTTFLSWKTKKLTLASSSTSASRDLFQGRAGGAAERAWLIPKHFLVLGVSLKCSGRGTTAQCHRSSVPVAERFQLRAQWDCLWFCCCQRANELCPSFLRNSIQIWDFCFSLPVCEVWPLDATGKQYRPNLECVRRCVRAVSSICLKHCILA